MSLRLRIKEHRDQLAAASGGHPPMATFHGRGQPPGASYYFNYKPFWSPIKDDFEQPTAPALAIAFEVRLDVPERSWSFYGRTPTRHYAIEKLLHRLSDATQARTPPPEIINDKGALGVTPERIASIAIAGEREPLYALILGRARARRGDGWQVTDAMHTPQIWWSDRRRRDPSRYCTERSRAAASSSESQEPQDLVYRTP